MTSEPNRLAELVHKEMKSLKTGEIFSRSAVLTDLLGFKNIFVHHEILTPGKRASSPHSHSHQEEMIFVLKGNPTAHQGSKSYELAPGDFMGFAPSHDEFHFVENKSNADAEFLVICSKEQADQVIS